MAKKLPGINFQAPVATDDLEFQQSSVSSEIQQRTRLVNAGNYGIVDTSDPRTASTDDLARPLNVTPSTDPLKVDVTPGTAVTASGNWVQLASKLQLLELISVAVGAINVVYIEYTLEDGKARRLNTFNVDVAVRQQRPDDNSSTVKVTTLQNWQNVNLFPPSKKEDIVVLAMVTVNQLADLSLDLTIDLTGLHLPDNRPWYSPVDIAHRNKAGTAEVTDNNPHGLSLNDLASGPLTLYQQSLAHGFVLSKDVSTPKYPGSGTSESLDAASFKTDTTGDYTKRSRFYGKAGAKWASLQHFPVRLGTVYKTDFPAAQVAADFVPGTNILVLPADEIIPDEGITVEYTYTPAGEAPTDPPTNDLVFTQPLASDLIIADGLAINSLPSPLISFDGSGPIPKDFRVFANAGGNLVASPQLLLSPIKLDALSGQVAITRGMQGEAFIEIGLTRANKVSTMEIVLSLTGQDKNSMPVTEELIFSDANWNDTAIPASTENRTQFQKTNALFKTLDTIEVISRQSDGNDSTIIVYADQEGAITTSFRELCPLADVFWDGLSVAKVKDARPVYLNLHLPSLSVSPPLQTQNTNVIDTWFYENLRNPRFQDTFQGNKAAQSSVGYIVIGDNVRIQDNDYISLGTRLLTAKKPVASSGALSALNLGIKIALGETTFEVDESPSGGSNSITITIPSATTSLANVASQIASELNANPATMLHYSCIATPQREFFLSADNLFDIAASTLGTAIGLLPASGDSNYTGTALPGIADGDSFTLNDGNTEKTFEFDANSNLNNPNNVAVAISPIALIAEVRHAMAIAIMASGLNVTATEAGNNVYLVNGTPGAAGNVAITESISTGSSLNPVGMSGGHDGNASAAAGEFNLGAGADADTTVQNIITTLADTTFDSAITGVATTVFGIPAVKLTQDVAGAKNILITSNITDTNILALNGFKWGSDKYMGISPDAFAEGLRTRVPNTGEDTSSILKKYRTRAVALTKQMTTVHKIRVILHNPVNAESNSVQVRFVTATDPNPANWQDLVTMNLVENSPNYATYEVDFGTNIRALQFEMFGQFTDFTVYSIT